MVTASKKINSVKLNDDLVVLKQGKDSILVVISGNNEFFLKIKGVVACEIFDNLSNGHSRQKIIENLIKKMPKINEAKLMEEFEDFTLKLTKMNILR